MARPLCSPRTALLARTTWRQAEVRSNSNNNSSEAEVVAVAHPAVQHRTRTACTDRKQAVAHSPQHEATSVAATGAVHKGANRAPSAPRGRRSMTDCGSRRGPPRSTPQSPISASTSTPVTNRRKPTARSAVAKRLFHIPKPNTPLVIPTLGPYERSTGWVISGAEGTTTYSPCS